MKHCRDNSPEVATGQLLGLDVKDRLEVTCCFPFKTVPSLESDSDKIKERCARTPTKNDALTTECEC
eukprot:TRINITY_DN6782_c0_g1_i1.p2 TRINITY_DN6782_c0_g1~~TRINITY_DN6782_c0_g1_i1.p2  ORF type:complete len:67 (-),score=13.75 TRINITY_DN6782_c0_g1_i1:168-368(-)